MMTEESSEEYLKTNNIRSILKVAIKKLIREQPKNPRAFLAQLICGAQQIDSTRCMLVSSDTPDRADFLDMVKCVKAQYAFETQTSGELVAIIRALVAAHGKFKSIGLASHGPADGSDTWAISSKVVLDFADPKGGAMAVLEALAEAVQTGGRVDLLACNLIATPEGKAFLKDLEKRTGCNFAASVDKTGNPKDDTVDWIMESDGVDIRELYFTDTTLFDGTFMDNWMESVAMAIVNNRTWQGKLTRDMLEAKIPIIGDGNGGTFGLFLGKFRRIGKFENIAEGAAIAPYENDGLTLLQLAAVFGRTAIFNELVQQGADVAASTREGKKIDYTLVTSEHKKEV